MKCILMNKNTEILVAEYNSVLNGFSEIYEIKSIEYAPVIIYNTYISKKKDILIELSNWFRGRGIPSWRDDLEILLARLNISTPTELLDKAFGLSLSDQYWIKPVDSKIYYENINFFENDFEDLEYEAATFSNSKINNTQISLISPNNTTDGRLKKVWVIEKGKRYLLKGGYKSEVMQPFNEVIASIICNRLGFEHVEYTINIVKEKIVSKCECFINPNTELITAYQILHNNCDRNNAYEEYIQILEKNNIEKAREKVENMIILDYIMLNEDRHLNNFGIIRNVETLKWQNTAPIFDNGQSLNILDYSDEEVIINGDGRFFYEVANFDELISYIHNIKRFDLNKLDGVVEELNILLNKYKYITRMTDRRIEKICTLLFSRIESLKKIIEREKND